MKKRAKKEDKFSATEVGALIENFDKRLSLIAEKVVAIEKKLDNTIEGVDKIHEDVAIIKVDTRMIRKDLKIKVDLEDFMTLEKRVITLEEKVASLGR